MYNSIVGMAVVSSCLIYKCHYRGVVAPTPYSVPSPTDAASSKVYVFSPNGAILMNRMYVIQIKQVLLLNISLFYSGQR